MDLIEFNLCFILLVVGVTGAKSNFALILEGSDVAMKGPLFLVVGQVETGFGHLYIVPVATKKNRVLLAVELILVIIEEILILQQLLQCRE